MSKFCSHSITIDDHRTGDILCQSCGLVLGERMFFEDSETKEYPLMPQELEAIDKWHLMLIDFTFNAGLPVQHALTAYNLYKKSRNERKLNFLTNNTEDLLFAAMYITLNKVGISYTLKDIAAHCNSDVKTLSCLSTIYSEKHIDDTYPTASNLITRICANLQIDRKIAMEISKKVNDFENFISLGYNPGTIASGFIFKTSKNHGLSYTLQQICELAGASQSTVKRFMKKFNVEMDSILKDGTILIDVPNPELVEVKNNDPMEELITKFSKI